jgi:hypothetical protein
LNQEKKNKLMRDAIYWHLIGEGYSDYKARIEADRRISLLRLLEEEQI